MFNTSDYWLSKKLKMITCPLCGARSRGQSCTHSGYSPSEHIVRVRNPLTGQIKLTQKPYINPNRKKALDKALAEVV